MSKTSKRHNQRALIIVLVATFTVWLSVSMSEEKDYPITLPLDYSDYDTARFSILDCDTSVTLNMRCTGFRAIGRSLALHNKRLTLPLAVWLENVSDTMEVIPLEVSELKAIGDFAEQIHLGNVSSLSLQKQSVTLVVAQRHRKAFSPRLKDVTFSFSNGTGIYGSPAIAPDSVYLYGSRQSLDKIDELFTEPSTISNIDSSRSYTIPLVPVWKDYPDLHPSQEMIKVFVPVKEFAENSFTLPLQFVSSDTSVKVRLYPEEVKVSFWVAKEDYAKAKADAFKAEVVYNPNQLRQSVRLASFPEYVRVRSVEPSYVQIVVYK